MVHKHISESTSMKSLMAFLQLHLKMKLLLKWKWEREDFMLEHRLAVIYSTLSILERLLKHHFVIILLKIEMILCLPMLLKMPLKMLK